MTTIAVILARQNSKGIALKNLQKVGGVSLLGRAIVAASHSQIFDKIVVSTDSDAIATEAKKYAGVTVIDRPDELASDTASSISGVLHALEVLQIEQGAVCLLQPTSPLRTAYHIQAAFEQFCQQGRVGSVIAACEAEHHPFKCLTYDEQGKLTAVRYLNDLESPRQQLPKSYRPNGAIYFNDIVALQQNQRFFNEPVGLYLMNKNDSIDIDTPQDLAKANQLLEKCNNE